jgi:hypothetical protein
MQQYTISAHCTINVYCPKKTLNGEFAKSQGGLSELNPFRSDGSGGSQMEGWTL